MLTFRDATPLDLAVVERFLTRANLPLDGVAEHIRAFVLVLDGDELVGTAAVERHGAHGLLRSVAVRDDQRGRGLGATLTTRLIERARADGLASLVLLTTTAETFFPRFGFRRVDRARLTASVHASRELQGACPASSVVLSLDLTGGDA